MNIGECIKKKRSEKGYSQSKLAQMVGIGQSMMAQIERGSKVPNMILGRDLARVLGCGMEELLEDK